MNLTYLQTVILYCLKKVAGERTPSAIFHLLNGKKSSQTIQDSHLFGLTNLYKLTPNLSRASFIKEIKTLESGQLIKLKCEDKYELTAKGEEALTYANDQNFIPAHLDSYTYQNITKVFWERLSLLVQVCSNLINENNSYVPIQNSSEVKYWIKKFLTSSKYDKEQFTRQLFNELSKILKDDKEIDQRTFVLRLSGYKSIGLTTGQAAHFLKMDEYEYIFQFTNVLHYLIKTSLANYEYYPILSSLSTVNNHKFTNSTFKTYQLLKRGYKKDEISEFRNLKESTIEDHLVEIALIDEQFKIDQYVSKERQLDIIKVANNLSTRRLKIIKEHLPEADYFEIRLVLAKFGDL